MCFEIALEEDPLPEPSTSFSESFADRYVGFTPIPV